MVPGRNVMYTLVGTDPKYSPASAFGYLVLILVVTRLGVLLLMVCPADSIASAIRRLWSRNVEDRMIEIQMKNRYLEGTVIVLHYHSIEQLLPPLPFMSV